MSTYPLRQHEAAHHAEEGHVPHPKPNTGMNNKKLGIWLFIASECMFFGGLLVTYLVYVRKAVTGPFPHDLFDIPLTTVFTFVLLTSSLTVVLADQAARNGDVRGLRLWLGLTILLGLGFLGFQYYEFSHFSEAGLSLGTSVFGSAFYVLTGFHGTHVAIGVIWFLSLFFSSLRNNKNVANETNVEIAGLYWHFVDVVWVVLFGVVYIMSVS